MKLYAVRGIKDGLYRALDGTPDREHPHDGCLTDWPTHAAARAGYNNGLEVVEFVLIPVDSRVGKLALAAAKLEELLESKQPTEKVRAQALAGLTQMHELAEALIRAGELPHD